MPPTATDRSREIATTLLAEFEQELRTTRKFLERIPADKLAWRPHEKSMTVGELALHMAQTPEGVLRMCQSDEAPVPDFSGGRPKPASLDEVLTTLDRSAAFVRDNLSAIDDGRMQTIFRIVQNGKTILSLPRKDFLRNILLNHWYHHRGQLGVYLRLLGAKVPSSYGPSGDEPPDFAQT